tara:strand:- start:795 stop:2213 length:1419 start_codon:yes stop_codon:yes gene_type:complete
MLHLKSTRTVYFIGIGGIGMSALARYLKRKGGLHVAGYDRVASRVTDALMEEGIAVNHDHDRLPDSIAALPSDSLLVVRTPAVPLEHPHHLTLAEKGARIIKRSELLGEIADETPTLAVAGTHGKTTTTAILAHLLDGCPGKCNAFLGGIATGVNSNLYLHENAAWNVVEADEFDRSFLHLHPAYAVITSLDADHLDIYGDEETFREAFQLFAQQVQKRILIHADVHWPEEDVDRYGVVSNREEAALLTYAAVHPQVIAGSWTADVKLDGLWMEQMEFPMPGIHNISNALAALALAHRSGAPMEICRQRMRTFQGIQRRFSYQIREERGVFIDDYAHHPTELKAAIETARTQHPGKAITGIFQPHLFSRTRDHLMEFASVLSTLDHLILLPVYAAREIPIPGIDSQRLFENIPNPTKHLIDSERIFDCLKAHPPEVLMTLGAGDIDRSVAPLKQWLLEDLNRFKQTKTTPAP